MSRTAFTAPETTLLGARPHTIIGMGIATHQPAAVWTGTASAPSFPADGTGAGTLTITTVSGSFANVVDGMTVVIGNYNPLIPAYPGENDIQSYYTYARKASIANTLYIDGLGKNTAKFSGMSVRVLNQYLPQPRRFRYDSGSGDWFVNFDTAFANQTEDFGPQAIMGPGTVVYKNGSVTSSFNGSASVTWSPGATITAHLWTFPDGTTSTSATPTWANSTAYPNGAYYHLRVTDSNGDTHTGHRLYFKFDSTHKPKTDFTITEYKGDWGSGYSVTVESVDNTWGYGTTYTTLENQCILFGTTAYFDTVANIGGNFTGSENIWLNGWVTYHDTTYSVDGLTNIYTISTIDELLRNQFAFPLTMDDTSGGAPTDWLQANPITLNLMALHYCQWRSTILMLTDVYFYGNLSVAADADKKYMDLQDGSMWDQLQAIYKWLAGGTASVDWQGAIYFEQDVIVTGDITGFYCAQMLTLWESEVGWLKEGFTHPTTPFYINKVAKFSAYGVDYISPVGSRAPDDPAAHGAALEEISAGLAGTQAQINLWAGNRRWQMDNHFNAASIPVRGLIRVDCTPQSTVTVSNIFQQFVLLVVRSVQADFDFENGLVEFTYGCEHTFDGNGVSNPPAGVDIDFT